MTTEHYELEDRFRAITGRAFVSGIQALARLPIEQLLIDRRRGLTTAAFISGYPGSPLGGYDAAVTEAARMRDDLPIHHAAGLNEEYAATSVMGSQVAADRSDALVDGVVGIWYGKAPGVDRAVDALRHGCYAGTTSSSGVVALVGDDPIAKSSTVPSSSAGILADLHMPLLYPGDPAEALDLGRHGIALSRATGLWSALKIVSDVADGTAVIDLELDRIEPVMPTLEGVRYSPKAEGRLLTPRTLDLEREIYEVKYPLAIEYARVNRLNSVMVSTADDWIGILASGITYREVREALVRLGLRSDDDLRSAGVRLFRMQMPIPFDPASVREFAVGLDEVVVVEEKAPNLELLIKDALYGSARHPLIVGKFDEHGGRLFPGFGALDADAILPVLRRRLASRLDERLAPASAPARRLIPLSVERTPFFCSGCPHNRSTEVPDGSLVGAGIGCHTMTLLMDPKRVGEISGLTPMGNEGTQWIGMAPFLPQSHMIQNLGDGTYFHSGQLAVTAAVAAGVNVTYKLLYNGAIAMTGGQTPRGQLPPTTIAAVLLEQGVSRVIITTEDRKRIPDRALRKGVDVWHRDRLIEAQEELASTPGVTVLIHDQACAAEARRLRKRGRVPTPSERVVINPRICEGCGDCGRVSNCLSVQPVETPFGRRTRIDQTTCNLDYSCVEGDCPSFMVVDSNPSRVARMFSRLFDRQPRGSEAASRTPSAGVAELPAPPSSVPVDDFALRIAGIGGTGVVTVAQILGTAAMLDGYEVRGLDQVGLSQKAGPVVSDLRLGRTSVAFTNHVGEHRADLLLVFDQLVAASEKCLLSASRTTSVVGSTSFTPTGSMVSHPEGPVPSSRELAERISGVTDPTRQLWADAGAETTAAFGDAVTANVFVVGMATQTGDLPIAPESIEEAIRLNGAAVERNLSAFRFGRLYAAGEDLPRGLEASDPLSEVRNREHAHPPIGELVELLAADLVGFQGHRLESHFRELVGKVSELDAGERLVEVAARGLHRVMAYKDEYEVARLMFLDEGRHEERSIAGGGAVVSARFHPPILRSLGVTRKVSFGPGWFPALRLLARLKFLRGTPFDPFGMMHVRREERRLRNDVIGLIERVVDDFERIGADLAIELLELIDVVRGYEGIKLANIESFRREVASRGFPLDEGW